VSQVEDDDVEATRTSDGSATRVDRPSRTTTVPPPPDFGSRYRVIGALGGGGMGDVFRAYDTELRVEVALKVIRPEHAAREASLARFRREIALARTIASPHVLRVYDLGEHDGRRFLSMQYVDGEDLAELIRRAGRLPRPRALALFRQVCAGVAAAHDLGIVHRDLKPQNVLVDREDRVYIGDFGLARTVDDGGVTLDGAVLGSPAYMSPEQVKGAAVDARADVYALGLLLFQLLAGEQAFHGDTPHALMEVRLHQPARPLRELAPDVPSYLAEIVARCLELDPARRYATARALLDDLAAAHASGPRRRRAVWLAGGAAGLAAVAAAAALVVHRGPPAPAPRPSPAAAHAGPTAPPPPTAAAPAVRPAFLLGIANRTGDPMFDGTLDFVLEHALRRATRVDPWPMRQIRSTGAQLAADAGATDDQLAKLVASRIGGDGLDLRGTVELRGAHYAIALEVTRAATGERLLAQTAVAATAADVAPTVGGLADALRRALGENVPTPPEPLGVSAQLEADHEAAVGVQLYEGGDTPGAITHLQRAVTLDPEFGLAHAILAIADDDKGHEQDARDELAAAMRYVDRLPDRDRLKVLGDYYETVTFDSPRAIASYQQLLARWPDDLAAGVNLAIAYEEAGDLERSAAITGRLAKTHPYDLMLQINRASDLLMTSQLPEAIVAAHQVMETFPRPPSRAYEIAAFASYVLGRRADADTAFAELAKLDPQEGLEEQADVAIAEGRLADAGKLLDQAVGRDRTAGDGEHGEHDQAMIAAVALRRGDLAGARAAAARITGATQDHFLAALVELEAGETAPPRAFAKALASDVAPLHRAWGQILSADDLRVHGQAAQAMLELQKANQVEPTWQGHYQLARAALDAGRYTEAYSEAQWCVAHRGMALWGATDSIGVRAVTPLSYLVARAQEGLGSPDAAAAYRAFLALEPAAQRDALADDARRRLGHLHAP
jgi:tetratricopeptide (TPR) repeat protein/predicted Ser/Thr protein kinase